MIRILTIVGARPQIIKAAAISRVLRDSYAGYILEHILHTGQHYDDNMSDIFFRELGVPMPAFRIDPDRSSAATQQRDMEEGIRLILQTHHYDAVLVYGDTNSTLAGAQAAAACKVPLIHVEAGLRSFNDEMPEERNRRETDQLACMLFAPTLTAISNLTREGLGHQPPDRYVYHCGDVMYDNALFFGAETSGAGQNYHLLTLHRNTNTDQPEVLRSILDAVIEIGKSDGRIIFPLHPRTRATLGKLPGYFKALSQVGVELVEPCSYREMLRLISGAEMVLTDSGGVQKEAFFFRKPCLILREETEWVELVECGAAVIAGCETATILSSCHNLKRKHDIQFPEIFGNGRAADFICGKIAEVFTK